MGAITFNIQNNYTATTNPLITSDISLGYDIGSQWLNTTTNILYTCISNTSGNAVWVESKTTPLNTVMGFPYVETFVSSLTGGIINITNTSSGGGSTPTAQQAENGHPGIRRLRTGSTLASIGSCIDTSTTGLGGLVMSDGITEIRTKQKLIGAIPNLTDTFKMFFGVCQSASFTPTFAVRWLYDYATFGGDGFFRLEVLNGANFVRKTTAITWTASSDWVEFGIKIYGSSTLAPNRYVEFYFGNDAGVPYSLVNTITESEMLSASVVPPFSLANVATYGYGIQKPSGTAVERQIWADLISFNKILI